MMVTGVPGRNGAMAAVVAEFAELADHNGFAAGGRARPGDRNFDDLLETVELDYRQVDPPGPSLGDWDTYETVLCTRTGDHVAALSGTGRMLYQRSRDGHLMMFYRERLTLLGGTAQTAGWADASEILAGGAQRFPLVGTGGDLAGTFGIRSLRPTPDRPHSLYESGLVLRSMSDTGSGPSDDDELDLLLGMLIPLVCPAVNPPTANGRLDAPALSAYLSQ